MAQVINTNALSLTAQNNLNKSQSMLGDAIERLSSGLRINSAKDDAAGQAIANRFTANVRGLTQAARNANDGISIAQTTEGALNEINNNLQRIRELTVQAQNGTNSKSDLTSIQAEITQRLDEIDRVSAQTQFNGVNVLAKDNNLAIQVGANDGQRIDIKLSEVTRNTLNLGGLDVTDKSGQLGSQVKDGDTVAISGKEKLDIVDKDGNKLAATVHASLIEYKDASGNISYAIKVFTPETKGDGGTTPAKTEYFDVAADAADGKKGFADVEGTGGAPGTATVKEADKPLDTTKDAAKIALIEKGTGHKNGDMIVHEITAKIAPGLKVYNITAKDGSNSGKLAVEQVATDGTGTVSYVYAKAGTPDATDHKVELTADTAVATIKKPLADIDKALAQVDENRSQLGAIQNRFTSAIANLNNTVNNLSSARSRIEDADYATEVSNMTRAQILQQAGTAVLAQANQVPQNVLSLLR